MTTLCFDTDEKWVHGELVCVDPLTRKAVHYDAKEDLPVLGAVFKSEEGKSSNGRMWYAINGPPFYSNDSLLYDESLRTSGAENINYSIFNPDDNGKVVVIVNGMTCVLKTESPIPSSWILISVGTTYDWYIVK